MTDDGLCCDTVCLFDNLAGFDGISRLVVVVILVLVEVESNSIPKGVADLLTGSTLASIVPLIRVDERLSKETAIVFDSDFLDDLFDDEGLVSLLPVDVLYDLAVDDGMELFVSLVLTADEALATEDIIAGGDDGCVVLVDGRHRCRGWIIWTDWESSG